MSARPTMPTGLHLVRTTPEFTDESVPAGLLGTHEVGQGSWGRLRVHAGALRFVFENDASDTHDLAASESIDIPPLTPHHVEPQPGCRFVVEFHRS